MCLQSYFSAPTRPARRTYNVPSIIGFIPPYALQRILRSLEQMEPGGSAPRDAYIWALVTFIAHMSFAQFDIVHRWHTRRCYEVR